MTSIRSLRLAILFLLISTLSCTGLSIDEEILTEQLEQNICSMKSSNISVDSILFQKDSYVVTFSNGKHLSCSQEEIPLISINDTGYWNLNRAKTDIVLEEEYVRDYGSDDELICIIEGYTDWSFLFRDGQKVSLIKSIYSYDPDEIKRGINHRGFNGIAPENTLPAYRLSRLMGFKYVETDVQFTADGVPVLLHDGTVDRTTNGKGRISELTWDQVCKLDSGTWKGTEYAGTRIPSLEEFLHLCKQIGLSPYLELKAGTRKQMEQIVQLVEECELTEDVIYISFSSTLLKFMSIINPSATLGFLTGTPLTEEMVSTALDIKTGNNIVFIDSSDKSPAAASLCRQADIPLEVWTVNTENAIKSLPSYITGVTSDSVHAGRVLKDAM